MWFGVVVLVVVVIVVIIVFIGKSWGNENNSVN